MDGYLDVDGDIDSSSEGFSVGIEDAETDGFIDGPDEGIDDGEVEGFNDGLDVGASVVHLSQVTTHTSYAFFIDPNSKSLAQKSLISFLLLLLSQSHVLVVAPVITPFSFTRAKTNSSVLSCLHSQLNDGLIDGRSEGRFEGLLDGREDG